MAAKLHVGNLPFDATDETIRAMFARAGTVLSVTLMKDRFTGDSKRLAFVEMASPEETQAAIAALHGHTIGDRRLTVRLARPGEETAPYRNRSRPRRSLLR